MNLLQRENPLGWCHYSTARLGCHSHPPGCKICLEVPDTPGEGARILTALQQEGINLLACCGFPLPSGKVQIDLVPEKGEALRKVARKLDVQLSDPKKAFLIQGRDRIGAVAETFTKLAHENINLVAAQALSSGSGHWAMILWVKPADYQQASKVLRG